MTDAVHAKLPDDPAEWLVLGRECSWQGAAQQCVIVVSLDEAEAAKRERRAVDLTKARPGCPYCRGPVGRVTSEVLAESIGRNAALAGEDAAFISEILNWQPGRCLPSALDHTRAWYADQKRQRRIANRQGLH